MALVQEDIEQIQILISNAISSTPAVTNANVRYELELRERTTRVEEELKHQRELMITGFSQVDKKMDLMKQDMDKRFEQVDKRFEQVDKRLELMKQDTDKRFDQVDKRFDQVDKRLELMKQDTDKRFDHIDIQFGIQNKAILDIHQEIRNLMRWSFGVLLGIGGLVIGIVKIMQ
ncbi:MAG: hypothetical protein QM500_00225 [Methylococcales bacterium]